jgi:hypothetical protein
MAAPTSALLPASLRHHALSVASPLERVAAFVSRAARARAAHT